MLIYPARRRAGPDLRHRLATACTCSVHQPTRIRWRAPASWKKAPTSAPVGLAILW